MVGFIQSATVNDAHNTDYFSGGNVEVNGVKVVIPRNTIFQMPATQMTWADMFMNAPAAYKALGQSGLALSDTPKPLTTYEVHVQGNRVVNPGTGRDQYIAGLVYIAQQSVNGRPGDHQCHRLLQVHGRHAVHAGCLGGHDAAGAKTGARMRINTPSGRYGAPDANRPGIVDKRFTADEDNPTIAARTGYPMCLPRFDPGSVAQRFFVPPMEPSDETGLRARFRSTTPCRPPRREPLPMPTASRTRLGYPNPAVKPDPFEQTPIEVGDYITFTGNLVQDKPCAAGAPVSSCQYISAHTVTVELGIYTAPGTWPVYSMHGRIPVSAWQALPTRSSRRKRWRKCSATSSPPITASWWMCTPLT